ncbi:MAG TPA: DMT family transporter [Ornithinicoccus sp.]|jgi:DME family drug/metabolite transporter|nr:DMT family transporter [Ornithinicoccus sp.]
MTSTSTLPTPARPRLSPLVPLALAGVLWGTGGLTGSLVQRHTGMSALGTGFWRLAVAAVALLAWHVVTGRTGHLYVVRRHRPRVLAIGLLLALFQSCYFAAVGHLGVGVATLVTLGSAPVLVTAWTTAAGRVPPSGRTLTALAAAGGGLLLVVLGTGTSASPGSSGAVSAGVALALLSASGFSAVTLLSPGLADRVAATTTVTWGFAVGALALLPVAALTGPVVGTPGPTDLALLAYLGTGPTAVAYGLYLSALRRATPTTGALAALLEPLTAAVLAVVVLAEPMTPLTVLGGAGVVTGLLLAGREQRP